MVIILTMVIIPLTIDIYIYGYIIPLAMVIIPLTMVIIPLTIDIYIYIWLYNPINYGYNPINYGYNPIDYRYIYIYMVI